jgi:hypothetical protein
MRTIGDMPPLEQIRESIDARIAEINQEIAALEAARAALHGTGAGSSPGSGARDRAPARPSRRTAKAPRDGASADAALHATDAALSAAGASVPQVPAPSAAPRRSRPRRARTGKPVEVLLADKLEAMLRDAQDGLSAVTISKLSNAGYNQVLTLLRELESAGTVRRTGARRTSLWRLITDEERIAERAAELERLSTTQR